MFEIGFSEMVMIAIVALIVLGPERLPRAARMAGLWVRRMRAYWFSMRAELERELAAEDMRKAMQDTQASLRELVHGDRPAAPDNPATPSPPDDANGH